MRLAIPVHDDHIAAVADFADALLLLDIQGRTITRRGTLGFAVPLVPAKVAILDQNKVDILICGAVSRPFAGMVIHSGMELVPFISGSIDDVVNAYLGGSLNDPRFFMPGHGRGMNWCCQRQRRRRGRFRG